MTILPYVCNCIMGFSNCLKAFKLQMVVQAPTSATASSNYYLGPKKIKNMRRNNQLPIEGEEVVEVLREGSLRVKNQRS